MVEVEVFKRTSGHFVVAYVVGKFGELVEYEVPGILGQLGAGVLNFLYVALRTGGADHVAWVGNPFLQPFEPFATHVFG